jgi:hypothetical protein
MELKKPDLTKPYFKWNHQARICVEENRCPHCVKPIVASDFKDALSRQEYTISGLCQECQDKVFGETNYFA